MNFVTYNIQYGKGLDGNIDLQRIADAVQSADVIAFQEIDRHWPRSGNVDQLKELRDLLPGYYSVYGAGVDLHVNDSDPANNQRRQFGNAIFSRRPIVSSRHHLLPKKGSIGPLSVQRSAIEASVHFDKQMVRIYSVHLTHLSTETRLPQLKCLLDIHEKASMEGFPVNGDLSGFDWQDGINTQEVPEHAILLGDFNCQPNSSEYDYIVGPISDYGGHITPTTGFVDAWCHSGNDKSSGHTSDVNDIPARLDYAFVSAGLRHNIVNCHVDGQAQGSDHQPLWLEINV